MRRLYWLQRNALRGYARQPSIHVVGKLLQRSEELIPMRLGPIPVLFLRVGAKPIHNLLRLKAVALGELFKVPRVSGVEQDRTEFLPSERLGRSSVPVSVLTADAIPSLKRLFEDSVGNSLGKLLLL